MKFIPTDEQFKVCGDSISLDSSNVRPLPVKTEMNSPVLDKPSMSFDAGFPREDFILLLEFLA